MKSFKLITVIIFFIIFGNAFSQYIPIDSVRRQDANGVPLLLGQTVTVRGVVTTQRELGGMLVYFQDPTGGLAAYDSVFCAGVNRGDSIQVTGVVTQYNGLTELQPVTSFTVLATGRTVNPTIVSPTQIRVYGETYEGRLIRIDSITQVKNTSGVPVTVWNVTGSGTNYRIFKGNDSCEIRIYSTTNIANSPIPAFPFGVIALSSQFDNSPPYNSGYQIIPRSLNDFVIYASGGPLLSQITYGNILPNSVTISWTTNSSSDSKVRYAVSDSNYQIVQYTDSVYNGSQVTAHSITLSNLQSGRIYNFNVTSANTSGSTTSSNMMFATGSTSAGTINVYFNKSVDTTIKTTEAAQGNVNFQTKLLQRINAAQYSIDMALYSFDDLTQIRDALINAKIRGVKIRFVYDNRTNQALVNDLIAAGIPIMKRPTSSGLMHNKFIVFDYRNRASSTDDWVWTGSTNITQEQFFTDANNVIEIQDQTLAAIYTREFEEMWGSATDTPIPSRAKFGSSKTDNVPHLLNVAGTRLEVYFSPGDNPSTQIENIISNTADYTIYFSIYSFTRCNIANRMKSKFDQGKNVWGVFDASQGGDPASVYKTMKGLTGGGCPPVWNPPADVWVDNQTGMFHHKYLLIDAPYSNSNPITETGSFNYSNAATNDNDENFVIVYSERISNIYLQEFYKRYKESGGQGIIIIGIQQISATIPEKFELKQNYPNPFNPKTNIEFRLANSGFAILNIYNVQGSLVKTLINQKLNAGYYNAEFDASGISSGVYFYTLTVDGNKIDTKRMVLLK